MPGGPKPPVGPLERELGRIIRGQLAYLGWTHGKLAEKVGVSTSQMSRTLKGDRHMDVDQLARICGVLDVDAISILREAQAAVATARPPKSDHVAIKAAVARRKREAGGDQAS